MAAKKTKSKKISRGKKIRPTAKKSKKKQKSFVANKKNKKAAEKSSSRNPKLKKTLAKIHKPSAKKPASKLEKVSKNRIENPKKQAIEIVKKERKNARQPLYTPPPPPKVEVSTWPKNRVKNILVSQPRPESDKNPYFDLARKHNLFIHFRQFIKVEGLSSQDFRLQRIEILAHQAVILTSKLSVDHYFRMCNEMRLTVPETMKYFCINEQTAYYLRKYIQYRKRKIFFGHGTIIDLVDVIKKNKDEKFLLPVSDVHKEQIVDFLDELHITYTKGTFYRTVSADLSDIKNLNEYDVLVFFTPAGIRSLKQNFPAFRQGNTRIAAFGHTSAQMVKQLGYRLDIFAPNPQNPSMTMAIDHYTKEANRR